MTKRKDRLRGSPFKYGRVRPGAAHCHHCEVLIFYPDDLPDVPINQHNPNSIFTYATNTNVNGHCPRCHDRIIGDVPEHTLEVSYE